MKVLLIVSCLVVLVSSRGHKKKDCLSGESAKCLREAIRNNTDSDRSARKIDKAVCKEFRKLGKKNRHESGSSSSEESSEEGDGRKDISCDTLREIKNKIQLKLREDQTQTIDDFENCVCGSSTTSSEETGNEATEPNVSVDSGSNSTESTSNGTTVADESTSTAASSVTDAPTVDGGASTPSTASDNSTAGA